jgi:sialate O-acetylesterase
MLTTRRNAFVALSLVLSACSATLAEVRPHAMFTDHMVLQRGTGTPVYGTADPGEQVTVTFGDRPGKTVAADDKGKWRVDLDLEPVPSPVELTVAGPTNAVTFADVLVGDVWICSGQSNMELTVVDSNNAKTEIENATHPTIRLFYVKKKIAPEPIDTVDGRWQVCSPQTVRDFSAVGYFFGRQLNQDLNVPIGLINSNWGGTPAEAWISQAALESEPLLARFVEYKATGMAQWPEAKVKWAEAKKKYQADLAAWNKEFGPGSNNPATRPGAATPKPTPPQPPGVPIGPEAPWLPAGLFNGMINPIIPYAIKGVIWYQGEANVGRGLEYRTLFPAMIKSWRDSWGRGDFPFYHVQLANFMAREPEPGESGWAELREAQSMTAANIPNGGQAVIIDIGDEKDIHPRNKQDVGRRLALVALAKTYGKDMEYSGPVFDSMTIDGNVARLKFTHAGGMTSKSTDGKVKGFAIAGEDKTFVWADATIEGDTVLVSSPKVEKPIAVRYGWADNPEVSLYNSAGLPASPFRTDASTSPPAPKQ